MNSKSGIFLCFLLWMALLSPAFVNAQKKDLRPNILFCLADDASMQHFGAYGSKWVKTPAFDGVARRGLLFRNAYTPNAKCAPSRASILTGRNPWQLEEIGNHLAYWPEKYVSVIERIGRNHYATGYTGKGWGPGEAGTKDGSPRELTGKAYDRIKLKPPTTGIRPLDYAANFEDFLENKEADKPFFFWFGSSEPHRTYAYGSGRSIGKKSLAAIGDVPGFWPDNDSVRNDLLDYALEVEYFDEQVGKMIAVLDKKGMLSNTLIVITSDNGMPFPRVKGFQYEMSNHMPLAIQWLDGIKKPGRIIDDYVSFIDFAPTFLEISETAVDSASHNLPQGRSLTNIFNTEKSGHIDPLRDHVLLGQERHDVGRPHEVGYPIRSIIKDGFMLIRNFEPDRWPAGNPETGYLNTDGSPTKTVILNANRARPGQNFYWQICFGKRGDEEFYHLKNDPECMVNEINNEKYAARIESMRRQMFQALKSQQDPRMFGKGYLFDNYRPTQGEDFYKKFRKGQHPQTGWVNPSDYETDPRIIGGETQ